MATRLYKVPSDNALQASVIGKDSEVFTAGDAVYINTDGYLAVATTSSKIYGWVADTITMASTNSTVAKVMPNVIPAGPGVQVVITSDQACTQTDIGAYADLATVTTGAQVLDLAAGATGQFLVMGFDPEGEGTTTDVVVEVAEPQRLAFAQS